MIKYRTLFACCFLAVCVLVALAMCRTIASEKTADSLFSTAAWALAALGAGVAGKGAVGVLAQGGGVKGAKAALLTDATPGEPAP